jgi:hypothetical protein
MSTAPQLYYAKTNGEEHGPYSGEQLLEMVKQGQLKPTDEIRRTQSANWHIAAHSKRLFPDAAVPPSGVKPPNLPSEQNPFAEANPFAETNPFTEANPFVATNPFTAEREGLSFAGNSGFRRKLLAAAGVLFVLCVGYFAFSGVLSNGSGGGNKDAMEGAIRLLNDVEMPRRFGDGDQRRNDGKEAIKRLRAIDTRGCPSDFRKAFEKCRKSKIKRAEASAEYQDRGQAYSMGKLDED